MFETNEFFWKAFNRFNALNGEGNRWDRPTARKEHEDLFGDVIKIGDTYFTRQSKVILGRNPGFKGQAPVLLLALNYC